MSSHTPGPWNAVESQPGIYWIDTREGSHAYGDIATVLEGGMDPEENAANARLIAAAPDLLAALEDAREEIAMRVLEDGGDLRSVTKACAKYDAAIAKARGK